MKSIVLAGDYGYIRQIETTIKSLCCYHEDLLIYVFNQDIPQEWFINTRKKVKGTGNNLLILTTWPMLVILFQSM